MPKDRRLPIHCRLPKRPDEKRSRQVNLVPLLRGLKEGLHKSDKTMLVTDLSN